MKDNTVTIKLTLDQLRLITGALGVYKDPEGKALSAGFRRLYLEKRDAMRMEELRAALDVLDGVFGVKR